MISVDARSPVPPFEQIRSQLAQQIGDGTLITGTKLPTVRSLAADLGVAVNTVHRAYQELEHAGLVETRGRRGTVVLTGADAVHARLHEAAAQFARVAQQAGTDRAEAVRILDIVFGDRSAHACRPSADRGRSPAVAPAQE